MLNELRELAVCLEKAGIAVEDLHPKFKACPKYLTYWVYLDEHGNITGIAPVPAMQVQKIRKWEKANGVSFPAFNMPPLFKAASEELQDRVKVMKKSIEKGITEPTDELLATVNSCETQWDKGIIKKLNDCLTKPIADISGYFGAAPDKCTSIAQLCARTQLVKAATFKDQLATAFLQSLQDAPSTDLIDVLFFFSGQAAKNFQIILELADRDSFEYPANHQEVQRWMNKQFLTSLDKADCADLDAFGCNATGKDSKFPPVGFKNALGNVILRAMNQESPCQTRYGMIDYHSFPAGEEVRKGMKSALEWLGSAERKGKTWCDLSRRMEKPMLLFAYPSVMPQDLPDLAGMMGDVEVDSTESNDELFAVLSEKVTSALRGEIKDTVSCEIRVFVLAKMDKARTKVLTSSRFSAEHVIQSAQNWQVGCRSLPVIEVRCLGKTKGDNETLKNPLIPFPAEVVWCLNTVWMAGRDKKGKRCGRANVAQGFDINDALCLLLGTGGELKQVAIRAIGALIRNSTPLLLPLGQASVLKCVYPTEKFTKQTLLLPSIIGLLLNKLGHTKGAIMASPAFLVGRFLSLADSLHLEYCKHVRNNSIPPQLLGNAHIAIALDSPERGFSMLSQRLPHPYQSWAYTVTGGGEVALAKYCLKQLGEVSEQLKDIPLPQQASDTDKAQMLLGYLARTKQD